MCSWSVMGTLKRSNSAQQVHNKTDVKIVCRQLQDSSIVVVVTLICVFVCYLYLIYLCYFFNNAEATKTNFFIVPADASKLSLLKQKTINDLKKVLLFFKVESFNIINILRFIKLNLKLSFLAELLSSSVLFFAVAFSQAFYFLFCLAIVAL